MHWTPTIFEFASYKTSFEGNPLYPGFPHSKEITRPLFSTKKLQDSKLVLHLLISSIPTPYKVVFLLVTVNFPRLLIFIERESNRIELVSVKKVYRWTETVKWRVWHWVPWILWPSLWQRAEKLTSVFILNVTLCTCIMVERITKKIHVTSYYNKKWYIFLSIT